MKTEQHLSKTASAVDIQVDDIQDLDNFEYDFPGVCQKTMKTCNNTASASNVLITNKKKICAYVGPSKLYIVMKGMKIQNTEVTTIKFIGNVPRSDISAYISRRPNVEKVITEHGPICCTWSEFNGVRKNLKSFVVRSGDGYMDICDFITF